MNILEITTNLRLRLDYFSMPEIRDRIVDVVHKMGNMGVPEKRLMTTYDQELLDTDSISSVLEVTIEEILQRQVMVFTKALIAGCQARIYVSEYFSFINININENAPLESYDNICKELKVLAEKIFTQKDGFDLKRLTTTVFAPCIIGTQDIENTLNTKYFPIIEEKGVNARYAEKYSSGYFTTEVIRDIALGNVEAEGENNEVYKFEISVNSYINVIPEDKTLYDMLKEMYSNSINVTNKYFHV